MKRKLIVNDLKRNPLINVVTFLFMLLCSLLISIAIMLFVNLSGAIDNLMECAQTPSVLQMHMGQLDQKQLDDFANANPQVKEYQVLGFLNVENQQLAIEGQTLASSSQDNGFCVQSEKFDYLLDLDNQIVYPTVGEVYIPICYKNTYSISVGDELRVDSKRLRVKGFIRDSQMNSMMASSKRFLINQQDYNDLQTLGQEEYLIEFLLNDQDMTSDFCTQYVDAGLPLNGPTITYPLIKLMNALSDGMMIMLILLASAIVLIISIICIRFIVLTGIEKDQREIGMQKAIGISRKQIRYLYMFKYIVLSLSGTVVGMLFAKAILPNLMQQIKNLYGVSSSSLKLFLYSVCGVTIIQGLIILSIHFSLKKIEKLTVVEALNGTASKQSKNSDIVWIGVIVAICVFLMFIPSAISKTISSPSFVTYMGIGDADLRVDIRQIENVKNISAQLQKSFDENERIKDYAFYNTSLYPVILSDGQKINFLIETGEHDIFPISYSKGCCPKEEDEIAISYLNAQELGVDIGDTIKIVCGNATQNLKITGIYSDITNGGKTAKWYRKSEEVFVEDVPSMWSVAYIKCATEVVGDKEKIVEAYSKITGVEVVDISDYLYATYGPTISALERAKVLTYFVGAGVIFIVVILFSRLQIAKSRMDISLKKALGYSTRYVRRAYLRRTYVFCICSSIIGIIAGILAGPKLVGIFLSSLGATEFRFIIDSPMMPILLGVYALGIAMLAECISTREISKINPYECCVGRE